VNVITIVHGNVPMIATATAIANAASIAMTATANAPIVRIASQGETPSKACKSNFNLNMVCRPPHCQEV
jgi:hypothetical protein